MAVSAASFRRLALSLASVTEVPHFERAAFRTPRRIFATLSGDAKSVNVKLEPALQAMLVARSEAFEPVSGKWGDQGWTVCTLALVSKTELAQVLHEAHAQTLAPPRRSARR